MKIGFSSIFTIITVTCLTIMFVEFLYSMKKKDGVYSKREFIGNSFTGLVTNIFYIFFRHLYVFFFYYIYNVTTNKHQIYTFNIYEFIICFVILDFLYYIFHLTHHKISMLWALHSTHHSDNKFNLSVSIRLSWFGHLYLYLFYLPIILIGVNPYFVFLSYSILSIYQFFTHSHYIQLPKFFDYLLVTPNNHKIHHDQEIKNQNSNFGGVFSLWDRLFGTYVDKIDSFTPGIKGYHQDNFIKIQTDPIFEYLKNK